MLIVPGEGQKQEHTQAPQAASHTMSPRKLLWVSESLSFAFRLSGLHSRSLFSGVRSLGLCGTLARWY